MKITPVKGTNDYTILDTKLRQFMQNEICKTYENHGFNRIITPIIEDIENLEKSDGGDNLNLIFKILKRGEKLTSALDSGDFSNLCDLGLRYDLTLPLSRFYAGHKSELPTQLKVIQIGEVFRAERPQKGRNREFVQCDIDILGAKGNEAEIELIDTTAQALLNFNLKNFSIRINDRRVLKSVLQKLGFCENELDSVCITFDKLDKIGVNGIETELLDKNFQKSVVARFCEFLSNIPKSTTELKKLVGETPEIVSLESIIFATTDLAKGQYKVEFDLSLVRGQSYYTGTVFEIHSDDFSCSIGGGGRYDNLIEKFTGENVCAVGFSIGFERLFAILKDQNFKINSAINKFAVIYENQDFLNALKFAKNLKTPFAVYEKPKNFAKLLSWLNENEFSGYYIYSKNDEPNLKHFQK